MRMIRVAAGIVVAALLVAQLAWNIPKESTGISQNDRADFNPNEAPKEAIQRAWRTDENKVFLQYTYSAPNQCWQNGNNRSLSFTNDTAKLVLVPNIQDAICAQVLTPLTYDQEVEISPEIEILVVIVDHPEGGRLNETSFGLNNPNRQFEYCS